MGQASHNGRLDKVTALSVCQVVATKNDVATQGFGFLNCLLVTLDTDLERRKPCEIISFKKLYSKFHKFTRVPLSEVAHIGYRHPAGPRCV